MRFAAITYPEQKLYEKHKYAPPVPRNAPPVAGNIMWARQLLRRIEAPMAQFATNSDLLALKEARRIVKTYNKARAGVQAVLAWPLPKCRHTNVMGQRELTACERLEDA
jgi:hypothetical protein